MLKGSTVKVTDPNLRQCEERITVGEDSEDWVRVLTWELLVFATTFGSSAAGSWLIAMAALLLSVASAMSETARKSDPTISGACRMHHMENCVRCSISVSGVCPFCE